MRRHQGLLGLGAVVAAALAGLRLLWQAGAALPRPAERLGAGTGGWLVDTAAADPLGLAAAGARLGGLAVGAYLVAATLLGALVRLGGATPPLLRATDRLTAPALRRLLDAALGGGVALSLSLGSLAGAAGADGPTTTTTAAPATATTTALPALRRGPSAPAAPSVVLPFLRRLPREPTPTAGAPTTTLPVLEPVTAPEPDPTTTAPAPTAPATTTPATTTTTGTAPREEPAPPPTAEAPTEAPSPAPPAPAPASGDTVVVGPGDSFWRIATRLAAADVGGRPTAEAVDARWRALVAANRDRLRHADQPDLLFTGQVLVVPDPSNPSDV